MQVVRSNAGVGDTNVEALYFLAIESARRTLDLTAAYFSPRPAFIEALCDAAEPRRPRARCSCPGEHIDKEFVRIAGRDAYESLLECGIEVYEYGPTMLHAKTLCIDGVWSSVGSVNFDNRSFQLQDEATLCVQSTRFAGELTEQFERDLARLRADRPAPLERAAAAPQAWPRRRSAWCAASSRLSPRRRLRSRRGARRARCAATGRARG